MKSAFGIPIEPWADGSEAFSGDKDGASVHFWRKPQGWCGEVCLTGEVSIKETIGASSVRACYQSLRGRVRNLAASLLRLTGEPPLKRPPNERGT